MTSSREKALFHRFMQSHWSVKSKSRSIGHSQCKFDEYPKMNIISCADLEGGGGGQGSGPP